MQTIQLKDKKFKTHISSEEILKQVSRVALEIAKDYKERNPIFLVVLNGAFMFASDLMKSYPYFCEVSFVKLASYEGTESSEKVKQLIGLNHSIDGRDIVIIEDIVDTGITMSDLLSDLDERKPASIRIATLFFKPESFQKDYKVDYIGFEIANDFIVGYGLDYDQLGRNLKDIYIITD
ncbi:MAG: hypoxanthine phosphoribosyltransferase [Bacteroidetes bacterium]|nr:MAG: hypoxanthine phosphoribosyltransferase [Bacteroidota bacterium]